MRGRVIKYFQDKGYGFIKDETGNSRFFHITKVKELSEISEGSLVEFKPEETNKGLACIDIIVLNENKPIFIALGDVRIKLSNIKNYGLDIETIEELVSEEKIYYTKGEKISNRVGGTLLGILGAAAGGAEGAASLASKGKWGDHYVHRKTKNIKYNVLYITTYQGDNFRFHQKYVDFDIEKKMDELDRYFCN